MSTSILKGMFSGGLEGTLAMKWFDQLNWKKAIQTDAE